MDPPQATTDADRQRQERLLRDPVRACVVTVEYVDAHLCIAEAREDSGGPVSITRNTGGIDWNSLSIGARLTVDVTEYNHAVEARKAP